MDTIAYARYLGVIALSVILSTLATNSLAAQECEESSAYPPRNESPKIMIGAVENVVLNPWGVSFQARIDTGADLSSLDARDIVVRDDVADFRLGRRFGGQRLRMPVVEWRQIQTATGTEKRPVVEVSICLGSKLLRTPVTLKDRSAMRYSFLVGRSALSGGFLVDPSRSNAARPICPAALASGSDLPKKSD